MIDKAALKAEAFRLGFWLCGVTTPEPPPHLDIYNAWITTGRHAGMAYLATPAPWPAAPNPTPSSPTAKPSSSSLLHTLRRQPVVPANTAKIAGYAKSTDYHNVFPPRLEALADWIIQQEEHPIQWRGFTDSAPILEKELARRAGLGWIGKNTNLISPKIGSTFLLAELFLDTKIDPDPPSLPTAVGPAPAVWMPVLQAVSCQTARLTPPSACLT